jgi:hypothetical protein
MKLLPSKKYLKLWVILLTSSAVVWFVAQQIGPRVPQAHIEAGDTACPVICKNDVVVWDFYDRDIEQVQKGDFVVLNDNWQGFYTARILSDPVAKACAEDNRTEFQLPDSNVFCNIKALLPEQEDFGWTYSGISNGDRKYFYQYDYLVSGHLNILLTEPVRFYSPKISMTNKYVIRGVRPRKIGNIQVKSILPDAMDEILGQALFAIYRWTGINLL